MIQITRRRLLAALAALLVCCGLLQPAALAADAPAADTAVAVSEGGSLPAGQESVQDGALSAPDAENEGAGEDLFPDGGDTAPEEENAAEDVPDTGSGEEASAPAPAGDAGEEDPAGVKAGQTALPQEYPAVFESAADGQTQSDDAAPLSEASRAGDLTLDEVNFPDPAFRAALAVYDTDASGGLSDAERSAVTSLGLSGLQITDLTGIALFENLTVLNVQLNRLTRLDLSSNTKLSILYASNNALSEVLLPVSLKTVNLSGNRLETLSLSGMRSLTPLIADDNRLTSLDLSDCPLDEGYGFSANGNYLTRVTLPQNSSSYDWGEYLADQLMPRARPAATGSSGRMTAVLSIPRTAR